MVNRTQPTLADLLSHLERAESVLANAETTDDLREVIGSLIIVQRAQIELDMGDY